MIDYFIQKHRRSLRMNSKFRTGGDMLRLFEDYHWPGNVRELSSAIIRLMVREDPSVMKEEFWRNMISDGIATSKAAISLTQEPIAEQLKPDGGSTDRIQSLKEIKAEATRHIEEKVIRSAPRATNWNKAKASRLLKISYKALFYKMKVLGIESNERDWGPKP